MRLAHKKSNGPGQTVNVANTLISSFTPASFIPAVNNCTLWCTGTLVGKNAAGLGVTVQIVAVFTVIAGVVALEQSTASAAVGNAALATVTGFFDASANIVRLFATGIAAQTIDWTGYMTIESTEF